MSNIIGYFNKKSPLFLISLALFFVLLFGIVDYLTGPRISFSIFYLIPISMVTWFVNRRAGILISIISAITWLIADLIWEVTYSNFAIPYWNATVRMGFFLIVVLFMSAFRELNKHLEKRVAERTADLEAEIAERKRAEEELQEASNELEIRVQERTLELAKTNERLQAEIVERKQAEDALKESFEQLSKKNRYETIISTITRSVHRSIDLQEVLENAVDVMCKNIDGAENISIYLVEEKEAVMKAYRGYPDWFIKRIERIPHPKDFTWKTILEEKPRYCADIDEDTIVGRVGREIGVKSYLSMPIRCEGKTVGVININSPKKNAFDEEDLNLLEIVAQQIEIAINNAQQAEALKRSEERFRILAETAKDSIVSANSRGNIIYFNKAAEHLFGYSADQVLGRPLILLMPERFHDAHQNGLKRFLTTGESRIIGRTIELSGRRKDGSEFPFELSLASWQVGDETFFTGILREITERKRVEEALKRTHDELEMRVDERTAELVKVNEALQADIAERKRVEVELKNSGEQLRALAAHLQSIREEEGTRIAREVHDNLGQALTGLNMDLFELENQICELGNGTRQELLLNRIRSMSNLIDTTVQAVREIATELRPRMLDDLGLVPAMEWQAQDFQERTGIQCELNLENINLDPERSTAVFRILQETLTNVARHAKATRVSIKLKEDTDEIILEVEDNGRGITEKEIQDPQSLGLLGMRERALVFGGEVNITGRQGKGTTVTLCIPI